MNPSEIKISQSLKRYSTVFTVIPILISVLVLIGWQFDIDFLKSPLPDSVVMKPLTALACILTCISLLILMKNEKGKTSLWICRIFAFIIAAVGLIRILEFIEGFQTGLGNLLYSNKLPRQVIDNALNYMAISAAFIFILLGLSLFLLTYEIKRAKQFANFSVFFILVIGLFSILGVFYGGKEFYGILAYFPVSIYTAMCFMFISLAILFYHGTSRFVHNITNPHSGGIISRLLILPVILFPILFGYIWIIVKKHQNFSNEMGVAVIITVIIVVFFIFVWYLSSALNKTDIEHIRALERISFLATIAENIQDPIITTDTNYLITDWNEGAEKLFGWKKEEALGKKTSQLLNPVFKDNSLEEIINLYNDKGAWQGEVLQHDRNGKEIHTLVSTTHIKDTDGNITGNVSLMRDISYRVKAKEELKKLNEDLEQQIKERTEEIYRNEKRFRAMVENNSGIIALFDKDLDIDFLSPSSERITGWNLVNERDEKTIDIIYPDDKEKIFQAISKAVSNEGSPYHVTFRVLHKNGGLIWLTGTITGMLHDPSVASLIGNFHDITELKKAEQELLQNKLRLQLALDSAEIGIYYGDFFNDIAIWDKRIYEFWGLPDGTPVKSFDFIKGVHPDDLELVETGVKATFEKASGGKSHLQYRIVDAKTGIIRWVDMKGEILYENGQPAKYIGTAIDITQRKQAEEELMQLNKHLRNLSSHLQTIREEERTRIAREIHDELGQQLIGLKMDLGNLKKNIEKGTPDLTQKANNMILMVDEAITAVRKIVLELRPGVLDALGLKAALEWQSKEFEQRNGTPCSFETNLDEEDFSDEINTTVFRIYQESLTNIVRHAKATLVKTKLYKIHDMLILEVIDNGKGITEKEKNRNISFGLLGMKERAGSLKGDFTIQQLPEGGTGITLKIPILC